MQDVTQVVSTNLGTWGGRAGEGKGGRAGRGRAIIGGVNEPFGSTGGNYPTDQHFEWIALCKKANANNVRRRACLRHAEGYLPK